MNQTRFAPYLTIINEADADFTERKSLFIGHAKPVKTEAEALEFIAKHRAKYSDATHNVYAYRLRQNQTCRYSDDGEPQGTAGIPVLDVIRKNDLYDICLVVTRYFGGILLGAGGLVRAYTKGAALAVEAAGIASAELLFEYEMKAGYSDFGKIRYEAENISAFIDDVIYEDVITFKIAMFRENTEAFCSRVLEITAGRVIPREVGERYVLVPKNVNLCDAQI